MDTFIVVWSLICAVISLGCAIYIWYLRRDMEQKKNHMIELRDEIVSSADITMELAKGMSVDLENMRQKAPHMPTSKEIEEVLEENGDANESKENETNK